LTVSISTGDVAKAGTAVVAVVNPGPGGGSSNPVTFDIRGPFKTVALEPDQVALQAGSVAVGDFNADGKTDLVVGTGCASGTCLGTLYFYPGNGHGGFGTPISSTIAGTPPTFGIVMLVGDFNADGKLDLIFTSNNGDGNDGPYGVIMLGNGDGTFTQEGSGDFGSFVNFIAVAAGDLNDDGLVDLITTGEIPADATPTTDVYLASVGLTYTMSQQFTCMGGASAVLGDFNGDGKLDLAMNGDQRNCGNSGVWVALGKGDGTFQNPILYSTFYPATQVVAADVNGDGKLDIVTDGICVLLGNGDGTFTPSGCRNANSQGNGSMVLGDFNGDGKQDVALLYGPSGSNSYGISVFAGTGKGQFGSPVTYPASTNYIGLSAGDFNSDGRLDFALGGGATPVNAAVFLQTVASISPTSLSYGVQLLNTTQHQTVVLTNDQSTTLAIGGIQITGANRTEFSQTNNCDSSLAVNASCQIVVAFDPKVAGTKSASLDVAYDGTGSPQTVPLSGTGTAVKLTPGTINFGNQKVGTTSPPQKATLTNVGASALSITSIRLSGGISSAFFESTTCGSNLAPGASCTITVTFTPNTKGPFSSGVQITDSDPTSPNFVFLNGTGT
jgi:hypothetical protein